MKKKIFTCAVMYLISLNIYSQYECDWTPVMGVEIEPAIEINFEPTDFFPDISAMPILADDRLVVWVHGLGGKGDYDASDYDNSWIVASSETALDYHAMSQRPTYTNVDLTYAAEQLKTLMVGFEADDNAIIIAHSQGGIVSRGLDKLIDDEDAYRTFGGLVTFGAPHQGARIINNIDEFSPWLSEACDDLSAGPVEEAISTSVVLWALSIFIDPDTIIDFFCNDILTDFVIPSAVGDLEAPIGSDYAIGAEKLAELNSYTPTIPYVCFYGIETEPVVWNTVDNFVPGHKPNQFGAFMANNDPYLTNYVNTEIINYFAKYVEWDMNTDYWSGFLDEWEDFVYLYYCPVCPFIEAEVDVSHAEDVRDAYLEGFAWWVAANPTWKSIIGQDEYVASESCSCYCVIESGDVLSSDTYPNPDCGECNELWGDCENQIHYVMSTKESDGVVLVESASTVLGMTFSEPMYDSNHFSMRNDHNTKDRLTELFNGDYGLFFSTELR